MMKPKISKFERQALRFAYQLALGQHFRLGYVYRSLSSNGGALTSRFQWIAPDSSPEHPYLNEDVLTALVMKDYMRMAYHEGADLWLYQLTAEGCSAMGWHLPPFGWYRTHHDPTRLWVESHRRPREHHPFPRQPTQRMVRDGIPADLRKRYRRG